MITCLIISNPASRKCIDARRLEAALAVAREAGWAVEAVATERVGHCIEIARDAAARGVDVIITNGGDGTINEAINGIAGTQTALAALRGGTANVWAREAHLHSNPVSAMRDIVHGERRRIDLGRADGRYFLLMAGIGLDAEIVPRVSGRWKRWAGAAAYVFAGIVTIFRAKTRPARVAIDGVTSETPLYWMLVSNTRSYGGIADIMHRARADDGLLDVALMHRGGPLRMLWAGVLFLFRRHLGSGNIDYARARTVAVETPAVPVQLDGELWGTTPMRFEIAPEVLTVIVPCGLRTPLFGRSAIAPADGV
jgi:YegS/Rv2252/BmrU family lipid kinase